MVRSVKKSSVIKAHIVSFPKGEHEENNYQRVNMSETNKMLCLLLLRQNELQNPGIFLSWVVEKACTVDCVFLRTVYKV